MDHGRGATTRETGSTREDRDECEIEGIDENEEGEDQRPFRRVVEHGDGLKSVNSQLMSD